MTVLLNDHRTAVSATPPSTPRLLLDTTGAKNNLLAGAWWPRSTDPVAELPGLVLAIDTLRGPITRLILHGNDWAVQPRRLAVARRVIRIGYFASQPVSLLTAICGRDQGRVDLLIVPPGTPDETADAAMKLSATVGNQVHAQDILLAVMAAVPPGGESDPELVWDGEGGQLRR